MGNPFGIRAYVLALVVLTIIPFLIVGYTDSRREESIRQHAAEDTTAALVASTLSDQVSLLDGARQVLQVLASYPAIVEHRTQECRDTLVRVNSNSTPYSSLVVAGMDGVIWCSSTPINGTVNLSDRAYFRNTVATRDFSVGDYIIGRVSGKPVLGVGYPILDDSGQMVGVMATGIDLTVITDGLAKSQIEEGVVLTVVDSQGIILARNPDAAPFVGKRMMGNGTVVDEMLGKERGAVVAKGIDGVERFYSYDTLVAGASGRVLVAAGVPMRSISGAAQAAFFGHLGFVAAVAVVAFLAALIGTQFLLVRPVRRLARAAAHIKRGDFAARASLHHAPGDLALLGEQFDAMASSVERLDKTKRDFINHSAHELATPLTPLKIHSALVLRRGEEFHDSSLQQAGRNLVRNTDRLSRTVAGIIQVADRQALAATPRREAFDFGVLVANIVESRQAAFEAKGVTLRLKATDTAMILGDPAGLGVAVGHILDNALNHTPQGGRVTAHLERAKDGLTVRIEDSGQGFDPARANQLFTPFGRLHDAMDAEPGLGLGLYFVRDVVERLGGHVWASSPGPGQGAVFGFTLPTG